MERKNSHLRFNSLEKALEARNKEYYDNFLVIKQSREADYATIDTEEGEFDTHGPSHLDRVQEKINELLGAEGIAQLKDLELYALLCAICLHDISMAYTKKRADHPNKSADIIEANPKYVWIHGDIKYIIGDIIRSHGMIDFETYLYQKYSDGYSQHIREEKVDVGVLMALLRMGDIMDWSCDRAPQTIREGAPIIGESFYYWFRHEPIKCIIPNRQEKKIFITGQPCGPFGCRILKEEAEMLNQELATDRQQLSKINVEFDSFSFDIDTEKKIATMLKLEHNENIFHPFISYEENEYLRLHGRDEDEDKLIRLILSARKSKTIPVLTGESGDGKTSLLKARIIGSFHEMGFSTSYFDDSLDALNYLNEKFAEPVTSTAESNGEKTERYLIILDQVERSFSQSKKKELKSVFQWVEKLVSEEEYKKRIVYFIFSVPDVFLSQLMQRCMESSIETQIYFLQKVDIKSVITAMLRNEKIGYDEAIINEITNHLLSTQNGDITNVHILFQTLLKTDKILMAEKKKILKDYSSVGTMVDSLVKTYFEKKFEQLTEPDMLLLKRACSNNGEGTQRVAFRDEEYESLLRLAKNNFIRLYKENEAYEFVHDILARKFYEDVLGEHEKEILSLAEKIHADSLDSESLVAIKKNKCEIAARCLKDADIANLVFAYMTHDHHEEFVGEADWWIRKYAQPDAIIVKMIRRIEKGTKYIKISSIAKTIPPILECAREESDYNKMIEKLRAVAKNPQSSYEQKCIAAFLLEKWSYSIWSDGVDMPVSFPRYYQNALIEPKYMEPYKEAYCYLLHYNLIDKLILEKVLNRFHFQFILSIFSKIDKSTCFYRQEYAEEVIEPKKFENFVSLLTPTILTELGNTQREPPMEFRYSKLTYGTKKFGYERDGMHTDLKTGIGIETLLKFSYKEDVDVVSLVDSKGGGESPVIFLKKETKEFRDIFTMEDVTNIVWQYKVHFANNYHKKGFKNSFGMKTPSKRQEKYAWMIARTELEKKFCTKDFLEIGNDYVYDGISGNKLLALHSALCYLNYLNLQMNKPPRFCQGKIVLIQAEDVLKGTKLYDRFYIELEQEDGRSEKFDPYSISGNSKAKSVTVKFRLITKTTQITVKSCKIKRELEFYENGSAAIAISIGLEVAKVLESFNNSFSFQIMWDDKVNRVSQAIDAWEYELNKVLVVLKENEFITDIFVFGNIARCRKTLQIFNRFCKKSEGSKYSDLWENIGQSPKDTSTQYFQNVDFNVLSKVTLHIVPFETVTSPDKIGTKISNYFLCEYNTAIDLNETHIEKGSDSNEVKNVCKKYLESINCYRTGSSNAIQVDCIDDAYKAMLASLVCFGNKQVDSSGADILDIRGFSLVVRDIEKNGFHLSYRRADVDTYYENQWKSRTGIIKRIADTVEVFNVNQVELITKKLEDTINDQVGSRKLMIAFYNPSDDSIAGFETPSLLSCFLLPRYQDGLCILDVIFVWRTNECVLGLPMSLEASIRWIHERIIPQFRGKVKIGNYTYFGASMHCADNFIMRQMITNIILADQT